MILVVPVAAVVHPEEVGDQDVGIIGSELFVNVRKYTWNENVTSTFSNHINFRSNSCSKKKVQEREPGFHSKNERWRVLLI